MLGATNTNIEINQRHEIQGHMQEGPIPKDNKRNMSHTIQMYK